MGNGLRFICSFNLPKSDTVRTIPFGLGVINVGLPQAPQNAFPLYPSLLYAVTLCAEFLYVYDVQVKAYYVLVQYLA